MKIKKLVLVCLFLLSGCNLSYNDEFYLETINNKLDYNQYGKKHFLEHHENVSPNETNVYIFKSIDDINRFVDSSIYFEKLNDNQTVEFKNVLDENYIVFVPIVLWSSAEFKCKLSSKKKNTDLTFIIGPFLETEEFFDERFTALIPKKYVDNKIINHKFEIIN